MGPRKRKAAFISLLDSDEDEAPAKQPATKSSGAAKKSSAGPAKGPLQARSNSPFKLAGMLIRCAAPLQFAPSSARTISAAFGKLGVGQARSSAATMRSPSHVRDDAASAGAAAPSDSGGQAAICMAATEDCRKSYTEDTSCCLGSTPGLRGVAC